jgi:hypothetical protein
MIINALDPVAWTDFFIATAGAGAALAGLVFVAFSINLREILKFPGLTGRGAESLILLLAPVFVAIVGLWPIGSTRVVGLALTVLGFAFWLTVVLIIVRSGRDLHGATRSQYLSRIILSQLATLPTIVAGISLTIALGPGLHLLVLGTVATFAAGVIGAWILLVEILR